MMQGRITITVHDKAGSRFEGMLSVEMTVEIKKALDSMKSEDITKYEAMKRQLAENAACLLEFIIDNSTTAKIEKTWAT